MFLTLSPLFSDSGKSAPFCNQSNNINQKLTTESELRYVEFLVPGSLFQEHRN